MVRVGTALFGPRPAAREPWESKVTRQEEIDGFDVA